MHSRILKKNEIFSSHQFRFREDSLNVSAVPKFPEGRGLLWPDWAVFCVLHAILLDKLHVCDIRGAFHNLFYSHLHNRKQYVVLDGWRYEVLSQALGVPQSSILGALPFLICISNYPNCAGSGKTLFFFADYTTLHCSHSLVEVAIADISDTIVQASPWIVINTLTLSLTKIKSITLVTDENVLAQNPFHYWSLLLTSGLSGWIMLMRFEQEIIICKGRWCRFHGSA